ncbi:MAG: manganese efflux pump [Bacteroidales bacterium]|nr:manganese efflux pump [Bacteroidales bacterium]
MDLLFVFLVAFGLSFDSFAVAICSGLRMPKILFFDAAKIAFSLAFFQGAFPLLGWLLGYYVKDYIEAVDHWIAFAILGFLGVRMVLESFKPDDCKQFNPLKLKTMVTMSVATSIDAFAVGITFSFIETPILLSCAIIGAVTFVVAMTGILIGKKTGSVFGKRMEIAGGIILILLGVKILLEHLLAA